MSVRVCAVLASVGLVATGMAAFPARAQKATPAITAAVADPSRPADDTKRDAGRKPAETLAFAGIKPGQSIGELFPGGGYFSRMLSKVVGPKGHVYLMTPVQFEDKQKAAQEALAASLGNASVLFQPGDAPMTPEKVDVVWTTDNYHDFHNPGFGIGDLAKFNKAIFDTLKPGGVYIIVDYQTVPGAGATQTGTLHRIEEATVKQEVEAAGFTFDGESTALLNKDDDHTLKIFDPKVRGQADQFILKFRKPK